jgi:hypothetical protein
VLLYDARNHGEHFNLEASTKNCEPLLLGQLYLPWYPLVKFSPSQTTQRAVISIMKEALRAWSKKAGLELERDRKRA